ncbi:hypothetical protein CMQ_8014 [Grosmannia clavigera kw1407]|uniref:Uncharacterized protein n=1 Tax=Grosmannia clavigera (strain kw1407 / UAMH 11150) TaxID=655863 RepID=F0XS66_GROCL|nr:uncharacterized protein CMQ_8014 [Grosmannia clavigera kw1407]EFW99646.1 hypothetical protein CMQ_8014 [Grosmannia clavigera kw1407]
MASRLLLRPSCLAPGCGLVALSSSFGSTSSPWQNQPRRSAHVRSASKASRSPTVRRAERAEKQAVRPPGLEHGRPAANRVFPADPSVLIVPLEAAIVVLQSELTASDCLEIIASCHQAYDGDAVSKAALKKEYNLSPYSIHSVALLLLFGAATTADGARHLPLATTLLHMAAEAPSRPGGYLPSTLTVLSMFSGNNVPGQQPQQPQKPQKRRLRDMQFYQDAEKRFLDYLAANQNLVLSPASGNASVEDVVMQANAFTQAGLLAEAGGNPSRALRWFRAASVVGTELSGQVDGADIEPREPRWDWERRCLEAIGRLQTTELRQQQQGGDAVTPPIDSTEEKQQQLLYQEARAAVRTAALALNSGVACLLLATEYATREISLDGGQGGTLEEDDPYEVETLLYRAAAAAIPGASDVLAARLEAKLALNRSGSGKDVSKASPELELLAEEWRALATASSGHKNTQST